MVKNHPPEDELANDVEIIREILFGEQSKDIESRIGDMEARINALRRENKALRAALEAQAASMEKQLQSGGDHMDELAGQITTQLQSLEETLQASLEAEKKARQRSVRNLSRRLVRRIERALEETNQKIEASRVQQDELVATLATALRAYQPRATPPEGESKD